jgi:hypothetical protein
VTYGNVRFWPIADIDGLDRPFQSAS